MLSKKISKIMLLAVIYALSGSISYAVTPGEASTQEYILNQGHSKEVSRLVEIEKARAEGREIPPSGKPNIKIRNWTFSEKASAIMRNIIENDLTRPTEEFGTSR